MKAKASVWILGNQLLQDHPALEKARREYSRAGIRILMVESRRMIGPDSAHPLRLVLVLSAMRHYAQALRESGYQVDYRSARDFSAAVQDHCREFQPAEFFTMASSNIPGRWFQETVLPTLCDSEIEILPNSQFLVEEHNPYPDISPQKTVRQESFYRRLREHFQVLMDDSGEPSGGKWNFDAENRQRLPADLEPPDVLRFPPDSVTQQLIQEVSPDLRDVPGFTLAVDHQGASQALKDFLASRLAQFGAYQDAMSSRSQLLYHSLLSPYLNLGLLEPLQVVRAVEDAYREGNVPLNSAEGFIRQVLGWREYIYWQYWRQGKDYQDLNFFQAKGKLPEFFWNAKTDLNCLQHALRSARKTGYNHHIERLMIISNFLNLTGVQPQQALRWFMASYLDAYPWVMAPNLIGMGLYADGGKVGSKPYIASANYINKMSDYCQDCRYDHRERAGDRACPYNYLYWNFLLTHQARLRDNPRMNLSLANLNRIPAGEKARLQEQARKFIAKLDT